MSLWEGRAWGNIIIGRIGSRYEVTSHWKFRSYSAFVPVTATWNVKSSLPTLLLVRQAYCPAPPGVAGHSSRMEIGKATPSCSSTLL